MFRHRFTSSLFCIALAGGSFEALIAQVTTSNSFAIHDGDKVVFYGDSITEQREYTADVEAFVLTRFPGWKVSFYNAGVGGDKVTGGGAGPVDMRLERDVFPYHPDLITMMLGMNDGYYRSNNVALMASYTRGINHLLDALSGKLPSARITLIKPSPYDDVTRPVLFPGGYNAVMVRFGSFVEDAALKRHLQVVDFNTPVNRQLELMKSESPNLVEQLIPDRIHPQQAGHWIMAGSLLKAWRAPGLVSSVAITCKGPKVAAEVENARVSELRREKETVSWTELEAALPLPFPPSEVDPVLAQVLRTSDLVESLDREMLSMRGLATGEYELRIDGRVITSASAAELEGGINLSLLDTPMLEQSRLVGLDTEKKNTLESARFQIINGSDSGDASNTAKALAGALPSAEQRQRSDAQPRSHSFVISPSARPGPSR